MPHDRPRVPRPPIALLAAVLLLAGCAHGALGDDNDLSGEWQGTVVPRGAGAPTGFVLYLDLAVRDGQVTGTGEIAARDSFSPEPRHVQVRGSFHGGGAILRIEPEGLGTHVLRATVVSPGRLEGSMDRDVPGSRTIPGQGYPLQVSLVRAGA